MEDSELNRRLDEVWMRVSGKPLRDMRFILPKDVRQSNLETMQFLKSNFTKAENEWKQLLEAKERTIADLTAQLDEMKVHLKELKQHYKEAREKLVNIELQTALKLEESHNLIKQQKKNHNKEVRLLKEILEKSKFEITDLNGKIDKLGRDKELLENHLRAEEEKHSKTREVLLNLENKIDESKKAVEETFGELLSERRAHSETQKRSAEFEKKIKALEDEIKSVRENWNAERKEWRELWERERSVWETHRHEFALWEEKLRKERELWSERIKKEEQKDIEYAARLGNLLKETSAWSEKVTQILKLYALKGVELPRVFVSASARGISARARKTLSRIACVSMATLVAFAGLGYWVYDYRSKVHFKLLSQYPLTLKNPTSISSSKEGLWISDWRGGIFLRDKKDFALLRKIENQTVTFRPQDIDAAGEYIWVLDMAQLRFVKKENRFGNEIYSLKTPGPAPQVIAFDGFNLWSFDASTSLFYRYSIDPLAGVEASFKIKGIKTVSKMQWLKNQLWILSENYLVRYGFEGNAFRKISSQKLSTKVKSFVVSEKQIWFLSEKDNGKSFEIRKYKLKLFK